MSTPTSNAEMKHTPTPRTDAFDNSQGVFTKYGSAIQFARTLEMENAHLLAQNEAMRSALTHYAHADFLTTEQQQIADAALQSHAK